MGRRVLIVDDSPGFRASARILLESEGFEVVGESPTGTDGIRDTLDLSPELVLLDIQLPDVNGLEVASRLSDAGVTSAVILCSSCDAADLGPAIERSGARGFIAKHELSAGAVEDLLP